jgi:hypothetical protein
MELIIGASLLVAIYAALCLVGHGYANTVDGFALFLHRHAERVKRMHALREAQMRSWWMTERRRMKAPPERKPVPIQQSRRAS